MLDHFEDLSSSAIARATKVCAKKGAQAMPGSGDTEKDEEGEDSDEDCHTYGPKWTQTEGV